MATNRDDLFDPPSALPSVIPEQRLVRDDVTGNYYRLSEDEFSAFAPSPPRAAPAPVAPVEQEDTEWADYGRLWMRGSASLGAGLGWAAKKMGLEDIGGAIETLGNDAVDYWTDSLSPAMKAETAKQFIVKNDDGGYEWGDAGLKTALAMGVESGPGTLLGMGVGGGITKVLQTFANPVGRAALAQAAAGGSLPAIKKLKMVDSIIGATGFGIGEGATSAIIAGPQIKQMVLSMDPAKLTANPRYREIYDSTDDRMSELERHQYAAQTIAEEAATEGAFHSGLVTSLLGAPMGAFFGRLLSKPLQRVTTRTRAGLIGAAGEALQEAGQSGTEQIVTNLQLQKVGDTDRGTFDDVANAAVGGAVAGAGMGGAFGALAGPDQPAGKPGAGGAGGAAASRAALLKAARDRVATAGGNLRTADRIVAAVQAGEMELVPAIAELRGLATPQQDSPKAAAAAGAGEAAPPTSTPAAGAEPAQSATEKSTSNAAADLRAGLGGMGAGPGQALREQLWQAHQAGKDGIATGIKEPVLAEAKAFGVSRTDRAEFDDWLNTREAARKPPAKPASEAGAKPEVEPTPPSVKTPIDREAHEAAPSPLNERPEPTDAQRDAGNYKKGHVRVQGLDISIENPAGSTRTGTREDGSTWSTVIPRHYGYIRGTVGKDKDHIDVTLGDAPDDAKRPVIVVDQGTPKGKTFDEHKVMLGFESRDAALAAYKEQYSPDVREAMGKNVVSVAEFTADEFHDWLENGDHQQPAGQESTAELPVLAEPAFSEDAAAAARATLKAKLAPESRTGTPAVPVRAPHEEELPDTARPVAAIRDADKALGDGKRVFRTNEQDETAEEVHSIDDLHGYTADQVYVAPQDDADSKSGLPVPAGAPRAGLTVEFQGKTYPVDSIDDAVDKWSDFRTAATQQGGGGVRDIGNGVEVKDADGNTVARVAYNGRVTETAAPAKEGPVKRLDQTMALAEKANPEAAAHLRNAASALRNDGHAAAHPHFEKASRALLQQHPALSDVVDEIDEQFRDQLAASAKPAAQPASDAQPAESAEESGERERRAPAASRAGAESSQVDDGAEDSGAPPRRRTAQGGTALEQSLSAKARKALSAMFKDETLARDTRYIREAMEVYERLSDEDAELEWPIAAARIQAAAEAYFLDQNQDTAGELQEATWSGLQTLTGEEDPDPAELLENEVFASAQDAGRLVFDSVDPRTASFDTEEFNTAQGVVEFRRKVKSVFPKPKEAKSAIAETKAAPVKSPEDANAQLESQKAYAKRVGAEEDHKDEVILSLFDHTGAWSQPYVDAGYTVVRYDIKNGDDLMDFGRLMDDVEEHISEGREIVGILSAPPCTSFAVSGARWWQKEHDAVSEDMVAKKYGEWAKQHFERPLDYANTLVAVVKLVVAQANPKFYVAENPVGRIAEQNHLPEPTLVFNPHNYGDPYTKRTHLWGEFNADLPLNNVEATLGSLIHKLRGDDPKQKAMRSATPEGFSYAFFVANNTSSLKWQSPDREALPSERDPREEAVERAPGPNNLHIVQAAYPSGMTRPADFGAAMKAESPVGLDLREMSGPLTEKTVEAVNAGIPVFVDSGAFGLFRKGERIDAAKTLSKYAALAKSVDDAAIDNLTVVAPDVVGDPAATLEMIGAHAPAIVGLMTDGVRVIVPVHANAETSAVDFAQQVIETLEATEEGGAVPAFPWGIPSNAAAMSDAEFRKFLRDVRPTHIHILGAASRKTAGARLKAIDDELADQEVVITLDANVIRSSGVTDAAGPEDRAERLAAALRERGERRNQVVAGDYDVKAPVDTEVYEAQAQWWDHSLTTAGRADAINAAYVGQSAKKPGPGTAWRHLTDEARGLIDHMRPSEFRPENRGGEKTEAPVGGPKEGDRVVISSQHRKDVDGRHGKVKNVSRIKWTTHALGITGHGVKGHQVSESVHVSYDVETDGGLVVNVSDNEIAVETTEAPDVVPDVKIGGILYAPDHARAHVERTRRNILAAKGKADRARTAKSKQEWVQRVKDLEAQYKSQGAELEAWTKKHGDKPGAPEPLRTVDPEAPKPASNLSLTTMKHPKTGATLYVAQLRERVSGDEFARLKAEADRAGGYWYGRGTKKGFTFNSQAEAEAFMGGPAPAGAAVVAVSKNQVFTEDAAAKARALLKSKLGQVSAGVDPELMQAGLTLAGYHIERGARTFAAYAKAMVEDLGDAVKPYLKSWYMGVRYDPRSAGFMSEMTAPGEVDTADVDTVLSTPDSDIITPGEGNERATDSGDREAALEGPVSGGLPAARDRGPAGPGSERGGEPDAGRDGRVEADREDGRGGLAGEPEPVRDDGPPEPVGFAHTDHEITDADGIGQGTPGERIRQNLDAIRLVKRLEAEDRFATPAEKKILVKYIGWGGLKRVFDPSSSSPQEQRARAELETLLTKDEYFEARQSTLNAFYTSPPIVRGMYRILDHFGFKGGTVLEPTVGTGIFIGAMPADMKAGSKWYASEIDPITSRVAKYLYPEAQVLTSTGFQKAEFSFGKFDLAIGNPPFGDERITDKRRKDISGLKIHNYVIAKSGMHLRPGGVMAMVVTSRFLDTSNPEARERLAKDFRFLGAVRLPNTAFKGFAGTEVTTDLVFLQKLAPGMETGDQDWLETGAKMTNAAGEEVTLNRYFAERPTLMLGEPSMQGTMYASNKGGEFTLTAREGVDVQKELDAIIEHPEFRGLAGVLLDAVPAQQEAAADIEVNRVDIPVGGYWLDGDDVLMREDDDADGNPVYQKLRPDTKWTEKQVLGVKRLAKIRGILRIREAAYELMHAERADKSLVHINVLRQKLNELYDGFVKVHGFINDTANSSLIEDQRIEFGLEKNYRKAVTAAAAARTGQPESPAKAEKSSLLIERVFQPFKAIVSAANVQDGYNISMSERGKLDIPYIAQLTGKTDAEVVEELVRHDLAFQDPESRDWVQEDLYLSGNVKAKLAIAKASAGYERNVAALEKVIPADVAAESIYADLGSTWIPAKIYEEFAELVGIAGARVAITPATGRVSVTGGTVRPNDINAEWKNDDYNVGDLFDMLANKKPLVAYDRDADGNRHVNKERTNALRPIGRQFRQFFQDWLFADAARSDRIAKVYNDTQNTHAERVFRGSLLRMVGNNPAITLRDSQKNAAWRMIQSRVALLDHVVGAGKTFTTIAGVMERKRLGLTRKAMVVVPNHLVNQWARDWLLLYPGANVLAATEKDFSRQNRRRLFARIATGKYDAIIIGHSSFEFIPLTPDTESKFAQEEVSFLEKALAEAKGSQDKRSVRTITNRIAKKKERIQKLSSSPRDNIAAFEEMGIDYLAVDEFHKYKNLEYSTAMQGVVGMGDPLGARKSFDMYSKIQYLLGADGGIATATGTPVSNSLVEMYTVLRYLNREGLKERGQEVFDSWAKTYASIDSRIEYTASGSLKERTVFGSFNNLPELMQLYSSFADIITMRDLKRIYAEQIKRSNKETGANEREEFPVPKVKGGGRVLDAADPSPEQKEYMDYLIARSRATETGGKDYMSVDNALWIISDAKKMALDIRMVDPNAPDHPASKSSRAAVKIKEIYDRTTEIRGTQLVFCDLSTPSGAAEASARRFITAGLKVAGSPAWLKQRMEGLPYTEQWRELRDYLTESLENPLVEDRARDAMRVFLEEQEAAGQAAVNTATSGFSVYDDIKAKLIAAGVPEKEVRYIHEANTREQKQELFDLVNGGQVRVLLGSTEKMGAGTNVQKRVVAEHHMDSPWKPAEIEQREGRVIRQGNLFYERDPDGFEVEIHAYSTRHTFDAVMWQTLQRKAEGLEQFRYGLRTMAEDEGDAKSYAEFMAESTGNEAFREKFRIEQEMAELQATRNKSRAQLSSAEQTRLRGPALIADGEAAVAAFAHAATAFSDDAVYRGDVRDDEERAATFDAGAVLHEEREAYELEHTAYLADLDKYVAARQAWEKAPAKERGPAPAKPNAPEAPSLLSKRVAERSEWSQWARGVIEGFVEQVNRGKDAETIINVGGIMVSFDATPRKDDTLWTVQAHLGPKATLTIYQHTQKTMPALGMLEKLTPTALRAAVNRNLGWERQDLERIQLSVKQADKIIESGGFKHQARLDELRGEYQGVLQAVQRIEIREAVRRAEKPNRYISGDTKRPLQGFTSNIGWPWGTHVLVDGRQASVIGAMEAGDPDPLQAVYMHGDDSLRKVAIADMIQDPAKMTPDEAADNAAALLRLQKAFEGQFTPAADSGSTRAMESPPGQPMFSRDLRKTPFIGYLGPQGMGSDGTGAFESFDEDKAQAADYHHTFLVEDKDAYESDESLAFVRMNSENAFTLRGEAVIDPYDRKSAARVKLLAQRLIAAGADPKAPFKVEDMKLPRSEARYQGKQIGTLEEWAGDPRYSRAPATGGMKADDLRAGLSGFVARIKSVVNFEVVQSVADVGEALPTDTEGVWWTGTNRVVLVADNIKDIETGIRKAVHEVFGHLAAERHPAFRAAIDGVLRLRKMGHKNVAELWRHVESTHGHLDDVTHAKEVIALMAERGVKAPVFERLIVRVREFLRDIGIELEFSEADIRAFIVAAARDLEAAATRANLLKWHPAAARELAGQDADKVSAALDQLYPGPLLDAQLEAEREIDALERKARSPDETARLLRLKGVLRRNRDEAAKRVSAAEDELFDRLDAATDPATIADLQARLGVLPPATAMSGVLRTLKVAAAESRAVMTDQDAVMPDWQVRVAAEPAPGLRDRTAAVVASNEPLYSRRGPALPGNLEAAYEHVMAGRDDSLGPKDRIRAVVQRIKGVDWLRIKQGVVDSYAAIEALERQQFGQVLDAADSAYKAALATRNHASVMAATYMKGVPAYIGGVLRVVAGRKNPHDLFARLTDHPDGNLIRHWKLWAAANRADRLMAEGRERRFTPEMIAEAKQLEERYPFFREVLNDWQEINGQALDLAEQLGVIDAETRLIWEKNDYVPFFRVLDDMESTGPGGTGALAGQRNPIKKLTGGVEQINDIAENMVMNLSSLIDRAHKNVAMRRIVGLAEGVAMERVPMPPQARAYSVDQVRRALADAGYTAEQIDGIEVEDYIKLWHRVAPRGKDIVSVLENGKPVYYRVTDPLLLRSIASLGPDVSSGVMELFGGAKRLLTGAVTADPAFMLANFIRDSLSNWVVSGASLHPLTGPLKGAKASLAQDSVLFDLMMAGGGGGGYYESNPAEISKLLSEKMPAGKVEGFMKTVVTPKRAWRAWKRIGQATENANRLAVYQSVIEAGGTPAEAAYQARDVLNFTMRGDFAAMRFIIATVPFMNARIQGLYRLYRGARDNPRSFAIRGMLIMAATAALMLRNQDEKEYEELPEWDKDAYWHIFAGGEHFRIPKPFEVGIMFATLPERMWRFGTGRDSGKILFNQIGTAVWDTLAMNPVPQLVKPGIEQYANRNAFTGSPIVGMSESGLVPEAQSNAWTSESMRAIAVAMPDWAPEWLRSPVRLQAALRSYTGTLGLYAMDAADFAVRKIGGYPEPASSSMYDLPVLRRFMRDPNPRTTKYASALYEMLDEANETFRTVKVYRERGELEKAAKFLEENRGKIMVRGRLNALALQVRNINNQINRLQFSTLPPDEKKTRMDALQQKKNEVTARVAPLAEYF